LKKRHTVVNNHTLFHYFGLIPSGINSKLADNELIIFPNPVATNLHFKTTKSITVSRIRIYSSTGIIVMETGCCENPIDVKKLPKGMYIFEILTSTNKRVNKNFIKTE